MSQPPPQTDDTLPASGETTGGRGHALAIGSQAAGRYRIVRLLGTGGMGEVYEAEDLIVAGRVALKTLLPELAGSSTAVERFRREIGLARKVTDAHVCRLHDVGTHEGRLFITMELLSGNTLADRVRAEGPQPLAEIENITRQLVAGLAALHAAGIVHRDFKTPNVILVGDRAVITDFGLARSTADGDATLTAESGLLGTPAYMAPEQVEGRATTPASDVYALGVVLFELATGVLPFREDTAMATATARLQREPPKPRERRPDLPLAWQEMILSCLAREPADRPSLAEVVSAFGTRRGRSKVASRRVRTKPVLLTVVPIAVAAAIFSGFYISSREEPPKPVAHFVPRFTTSHAMARDHHDAAMAALAADDWRAARDHMERAVAVASDDAIVQARWSHVLGSLGFTERAKIARDRAMGGRAKLDEEPRVWIEALDADQRGDHAVAIARWRRLVEIAGNHAPYRLGLLEALSMAGRHDEARGVLADAELAIPDPVSRVAFDQFGSFLEETSGNREQTYLRANRAVLGAIRFVRPRERAYGLMVLGTQQLKDAELADSERTLDQTLTLAIDIGDAGLATHARTTLADHHHVSANFVAKERAVSESVAATRTLGDAKLLAAVLLEHSLVLTDLGRVTDAEAAAREAVAITEKAQFRGRLGWALANLGRLLKHRARLDEAADALLQAYSIAESIPDHALQTRASIHWINVLRMQSSDHSRLRELRRLNPDANTDPFVLEPTVEMLTDARLAAARGVLARARGPLIVAEDSNNLAMILIARGELDEAAKLVDAAEPVLRKSGSLLRESWGVEARARLEAARGDALGAVDLLDASAAKLGKHGLVAASLETRGVAVAILAKLDRGAAAVRGKALVDEAKQLGLVALQREVEAVLARR